MDKPDDAALYVKQLRMLANGPYLSENYVGRKLILDAAARIEQLVSERDAAVRDAVAAERERCAKICDEQPRYCLCAAAIRADGGA